MTHFITFRKTNDIVQIKNIFIKGIVHLYKVPQSIRDLKFLSHFCCTLWKIFDTYPKFSITNHHKIDDQIDVVNMTLSNLIHYIFNKKLR